MLLMGPPNSTGWTVDGSTANVKDTTGGGSATISNLSIGNHSVVVSNGAPCTFTVDCYTSIDVANARSAIGSTDPVKLLLYDFNGDGAITKEDKLAIYEASKSCN